MNIASIFLAHTHGICVGYGTCALWGFRFDVSAMSRAMTGRRSPGPAAAGAAGRARGGAGGARGRGLWGFCRFSPLVFAFRDALAPCLCALGIGPMANRASCVLGQSTDYGKSMAYAGCACGSASGLPLRAPAPLRARPSASASRSVRVASAVRDSGSAIGPLGVRRGRG